VLLNNRAEGNTPLNVQALTEMLSKERPDAPPASSLRDDSVMVPRRSMSHVVNVA